MVLVFLDLVFARAAKMLPPLAMALRPELHWWPAAGRRCGRRLVAVGRERRYGAAVKEGAPIALSAASQEHAACLDRQPRCRQPRERGCRREAAHDPLGCPAQRLCTPAIAAGAEQCDAKACKPRAAA